MKTIAVLLFGVVAMTTAIPLIPKGSYLTLPNFILYLYMT